MNYCNHPKATAWNNCELAWLGLPPTVIGTEFHSPKNLSMALIAEAAELVEHFQWITEAASQSLAPDKHAEVRLELADILIYLIRTADKLDVDLIAAANDKIQLNTSRYPAEQVRGDDGTDRRRRAERPSPPDEGDESHWATRQHGIDRPEHGDGQEDAGNDGDDYVGDHGTTFDHRWARASELERTAEVVCVCHHGRRSMHVGMFLEQQGFMNVYNLTGGVDAWARQVDTAMPIY